MQVNFAPGQTSAELIIREVDNENPYKLPIKEPLNLQVKGVITCIYAFLEKRWGTEQIDKEHTHILVDREKLAVALVTNENDERTTQTIVNGTLFNYVKDAFRIQLNKYTTDQIVSNRDLVERAIEAQLSKALAREHFHLEQLTSGLKYPSSIVEAVNEKNKAIQEAQRALNEVAVKKAEAEKMLVQARAEREANELKTASLTPAILKKMWIEKWDGKLPVYGNVPQMMMTTK